MPNQNPVRAFGVGLLAVEVHSSGPALGAAAARFTVGRLQASVDAMGWANLVLATGVSQFDFLAALKASFVVPWNQITVFHLDEYRGVSDRHPASFRRFLRERILDEVRPRQVHFLDGNAMDVEAEVRRYQALLETHPIDIACIGIGENGHIAFNDPPVADFDDPKLVKVVQLDEACRRQQLGEGWFGSLDEVPSHALTLTIPAIMRSRCISCVVPEGRKARAVAEALQGPISPSCPASILRRHGDARLFLDRFSSSQLRR